MQTSRRAFISMIVLTAVTGSAGAQTDACPPIETRPPNVPSQRPAFPGQTRACAIESNIAFAVVVLAKGLEKPRAVEPLPGDDLLITEKPGRMRIVSANRGLGQPIVGCRLSMHGGREVCSTSYRVRTSRPTGQSLGAIRNRGRAAAARASPAACCPRTGAAWTRFG